MIRRNRKKKFHPGLQVGASALAFAGLFAGVWFFRPAAPDIVARDYGEVADAEHARLTGKPRQRRVYPMSVVVGGVYSPDEVQLMKVRDPVVAEHYRNLNPNTMRRQMLEDSIERYVSFRIGKQVYWTRSRVRIPKGEIVLADGDSMLRARCGNLLADTPQKPTLPRNRRDPSDLDLDVPLPPEQSSVLLANALGNELTNANEKDPMESLPPAPEQTEMASAPVGSTAAGSSSGSAGSSASAPASALTGRRGGFGRQRGTGALGSGIAPPSENPALAGPGAVTPYDPDWMLPAPPQLSPGNLPAEGLIALIAPSETAPAAVTRLGAGGVQVATLSTGGPPLNPQVTNTGGLPLIPPFVPGLPPSLVVWNESKGSLPGPQPPGPPRPSIPEPFPGTEPFPGGGSNGGWPPPSSAVPEPRWMGVVAFVFAAGASFRRWRPRRQALETTQK